MLTTSQKSNAQAAGVVSWLAALGPLVPLVGLLSTVPYALVYLKNLWELPHYQFFPLLLAAVGYLLHQRLGGHFTGNWSHRALCAVLLAGGILGVLCATVFASPWMGFFGFTMCFASWLGGRTDSESGRSLLYLALPILLIWQPPYNSIITADTVLIQKLQTASARLSSQWLDILGYPHHQPGTVLEFAGKSFGVAEACSGIQSFFAVVCIGALLSVVFRRGALHTLCLLGTSPFWAVLMNTIRITLIPVAYASLDIDLSHGLLHDLLGYFTMGLALVLMLSTDELLLKLGEVVPTSILSQWQPSSSKECSKDDKKSIPGSSWVYAAVALPFIASCGIQCYDVSESWGRQRRVIDFFRGAPPLGMMPSDGPDNLLGWPRTEYIQTNRERGNDDLGQRSDMWYYEAPFGEVTASFDQMFPGWHELTRCYHSVGWTAQQRTVDMDESSDRWPFVTVQLQRDREFGFLIFSLINRSGTPLTPPGDFNYWTILRERLAGRITPAVRGAIFGISAYQVQVFVPSYKPLSEAEMEQTKERFLAVREILWQAAEQRLGSE